MKKLISLLSFSLLASLSWAAPEIGKPAPQFTAATAEGKSISLSALKGKTVVLEWFNNGCPYVKKHYESGNMQKLQKAALEKGVVWLSVLSSARGKQGYLDAVSAKKVFKDWKAQPGDILLDPKGEVGKLYEAKTTPHMFVINKEGTLVYKGAIDSNDSSDPAVIAQSKNYVAAAMDATLAGKIVAESDTKPYGCGVKYE